jgi:hypothetical protein
MELAMAAKNNASPREALTFDDVLIRPGRIGPQRLPPFGGRHFGSFEKPEQVITNGRFS